MNRWPAAFLAMLSGVLLVLLYPPYDFSWLAPVALVPLLLACSKEPDWRWRVALGYACGVVYWFGLCNWIQWTLSTYAGIGSAAAWALFALFCLAKGSQMAVFGWGVGLLIRRSIALPAIASLWVALEWTHGMTGFEWLHLGNAGSEMSVPLRLAPFTGVWGLSFVFALMSAGIVGLVLGKPRLQVAWLLILPALLAIPDIPSVSRGSASAILLQPNQSETAVWDSGLVDRSLRAMTRLSLGLAKSTTHDDLIIWPEAPGPFYDYDPKYRGALEGVAQAAQSQVVAGAVGRTASGAPSNSAVTIAPTGKALARYDKINLVPFGEFVPWPFQALTKQVSSEAGEFESGRDVVVTSLGTSDGVHQVGTFICYESVFPGFTRQFANRGAEVLVNISNDGWFGKSAARYQHLRIVRMRAAENHRWILRATNNGVTAAIDPAGRVRQMGPEYVESALRVRYDYARERTLYTRWGDWFVMVCAALAAAALALALKAERLPG